MISIPQMEILKATIEFLEDLENISLLETKEKYHFKVYISKEKLKDLVKDLNKLKTEIDTKRRIEFGIE